MSTKGKSAAPTRKEKKAPAEQKNTTDDGAMENPGRKWQLRVGPMETIVISENAPLCQMVIQNRARPSLRFVAKMASPLFLCRASFA